MSDAPIAARPRIGFACLWRPDPVATWSHIPWHLRTAMRRRANVVDVGVTVPPAFQALLRVAHLRRRGGRFTSTWRQSGLTDRHCRRVISRSLAAAGCDAVVQIQDLAETDAPFFVFQDMSFDALLHVRDEVGLPLFQNLTDAALRRRRDRQLRIYEKAAGVLAMSHWLARSLVEVTGLSPEKVRVVHPGISASTGGEPGATPPPGHGPASGLPHWEERPRRRLLFVGREFHRKGGDLVVAALAVLRREIDPQITLTVVGPRRWPVPGPVPDGVRFLGERPLSEVAPLYDSHDLFVLPSRLEAFGIVFAEAAARGLPCVGRDAFAMPEVIKPGVTGVLASDDDPVELAKLIAAALADDNLYVRCRAQAGEMAERFSWDRAGRDVVEAVRDVLRTI